MTRIFHGRSYDTFIEIKSNPRRKKLHRMNKASNFNGGSVSGRDNIRASIRFKKKSNHKILKDSSSLKTEASIFTSIAPELSNRSNKTSWGFFQHEINNSLTGAVLSVAHRSYSSSEAICCHKSDASSHLV